MLLLSYMNILVLLKEYIRFNDDEKHDFKELESLLSLKENPLSRNNFRGHITASAFILNEASKQVLLLEHKSLGRLLQPGGHIEDIDGSILDSVYREIEEETGLTKKDLELKPVITSNLEVPMDIDTHKIPKNQIKNEPEHFHHDFRYLFTTLNSNITLDLAESNNYRWVDWSEFSKIDNFVHIASKIDSLFGSSPQDYFEYLVGKDAKDTSVVAVAHVIPSSEAFIHSLMNNFNLLGIIPKPKSINKSTYKRLTESGIKIFKNISRDSILNEPEKFINIISGHKKIALVDIGGYFAPIEGRLLRDFGDNFLGIIEDTENGYQKYEKSNHRYRRLLSVARSPLKKYEDQLVGQGIGHATETLLRQINIIITYKKCGIIGYGKIGSGIGEYLQQRNIRPLVADIDPLRSVQASCDGALVGSVDDIVRSCDVIFCATGSQALDIVKLRYLKSGAYIASATSSDDEFDLRSIDGEYSREIIDDHTTRYFKKGHAFHLLNDGNAVNFLFSAAVDSYINLVQGEIVYTLARMEELANRSEIQNNNLKDHNIIAQAWLDYIARIENI